MKIPLGADHFGRMTAETGIMLGQAMAKPSRMLAWIEDVIPYRSVNALDMIKEITARNGSWYNHGGPWIHLNENGELVNETGSR